MTRTPFYAAIATLLAVATPAWSGECPAGKTVADATKPGPEAMKPKGVTDTVVSSIDLSKTMGGAFTGHLLRLRRLVVEPGGVVPWHSHSDRPSNIYMIEGSITEYRSNCSVPIEHKAGEAVAEFGAVAHWWRNNTNKPAVLTSADLFHPKMKDDHAM